MGSQMKWMSIALVVLIALFGLNSFQQSKYNASSDQIFDLEHEIQSVIKRVKKRIPSIIIERVDERFTSKISKYFLNASSHKQKNRRNKENLDKISASLILQTYIDQK